MKGEHPTRVFWRCARCGYRALTNPYEDFTDENGTDLTQAHRCPSCGDSYWLDEETYERMVQSQKRNAMTADPQLQGEVKSA